MMTRFDAVKEFLGTNPIAFSDIITAFQLGNDYIFSSEFDRLIAGHGMSHAVLETIKSPMAKFFHRDAVVPDLTAISLGFNDMGSFFCTVTTPIQGTNKEAFSLIIGTIHDTDEEAEAENGEVSKISQLRPVFIMTAEVVDNFFFPQEARFLFKSKDETVYITNKEKPLYEHFQQYLCYADSAFKSVILGETIDCEECQRWFHPDSRKAAEAHYAYMTERSAEALSQDILEIKEELDLGQSSFLAPPRCQ